MDRNFKCIAIDDDPLFLRKLSIYVEEIDWLHLTETFNNPILGAKAIISSNPDLVFLDIEMPHVDGHYLIDWIGPRLKTMEKPPVIIIVSSLTIAESDQMELVTGYINKSMVTNPAQLENLLTQILD